jgi:SCP-2 sterol transfer family protein
MTTIEGFFTGLAERGEEPLLAKVAGVMRFDVVDGGRTETWSVHVDHGRVTVSRDEEVAADCSISTDRGLFERLVSGRENAMALVLRGGAVCAGDVELLLAMQRVFPGPPNQQPRRRG